MPPSFALQACWNTAYGVYKRVSCVCTNLEGLKVATLKDVDSDGDFFILLLSIVVEPVPEIVSAWSGP